MTRLVHRVALYGFLGSGNIGNDASFETVVAWFRTHHPDVELRGITIAPEQVDTRYGISSVPLAWRSPRPYDGRLASALSKVVGRLLDIPRSYRLAGSVDAVIVPGMGVLENSLTVQPWGLPYWLFLMAASCRVRRRHFVLLDVGAERARSPLTRWLYEATARVATHTSYRDHPSAEAMVRSGVSRPYVVAPDLAFAHPSSTVDQPEAGRIVVGVMAYYGQGDDPVRGAPIRRQYVATLADALAALIGEGSRIVLVVGDRVDIDVAQEVHKAVLTLRPDLSEDALVVRQPTTFAEVTDEMRRAEVVIASRFHNLIAALRLGRPTISVGYAGKSRTVMKALGLDDYCQRIDELDAGRLVAQVRDARQAGEALTCQIRSATAQYRGEVESLLQLMTKEDLGLDAGPAEDPDADTMTSGRVR